MLSLVIEHLKQVIEPKTLRYSVVLLRVIIIVAQNGINCLVSSKEEMRIPEKNK